MWSFGSPNKVLSLSQGNTASPRHGAGSSNKTTARIIVPPSFIAHTFGHTFGQCFAIFPHSDVDMWGRDKIIRFRKVWQSLNSYKEYLFGFETLVFATLHRLYMHKQLVTVQRQRKTWNRITRPLKKVDMTTLIRLMWWACGYSIRHLCELEGNWCIRPLKISWEQLVKNNCYKLS